MRRKPKATEVFLIFIPLLVVAVYLAMCAWYNRLPPQIKVSIGPYTNRPAEERAALKCLSQLLKQYPHATTFKVYGNHPNSRPNGTLIYERNSSWFSVKGNKLSIDQRPTTGMKILVFTTSVTDDDIHAVAKANGTTKDVRSRVIKRLEKTR